MESTLLFPGKMFIANANIYYCDKKNDHKYKGFFDCGTLLMCIETDNWFEQAQFLNVRANQKCWIPYMLFICLSEILPE